MFDNAVVGVDDQGAGHDVVALARELVSTDGNLTLVRVQVVSLTPAPDSDSVWVAQHQHALRQLAWLRDEAQVDAELFAVQARSVAEGLQEAVSRGGDLLVIGASRRDEYQRAFIGDNTREVLEAPRCAVAVAPDGYATRPRGLRKIGVAYNGSPQSERALAVARRLARERQAELSAFEAVPEPVYLHDPDNVEAEIEEGVAKARKRLAELGDLEPQAASGDAAEELARYAASLDLLVLGSHERRPLDGLRGERISQQVAASPACPLLVMSPDDGSPGQGSSSLAVNAVEHSRRNDRAAPGSPLQLIGVGVDGFPGGRDAVALGSVLARATDARLLLIGVEVEPFWSPARTEGMDRKSLRQQARATLVEARDSLAPEAEIAVRSDVLEWRGLRRVARVHNADMLVVGSGRDAGEGSARLGRHAGELQEHLERPLAIAPRGMRNRKDARLDRVGVGFEGGPESRVALDLAGSIAAAAGAELVVRAVTDERERASLSEAALAAGRATGARVQIDSRGGHAAEALHELCERVDLVVIGSCRSAPAGRILLGRTGHGLLRDAPSPVLVVPGPVD